MDSDVYYILDMSESISKIVISRLIFKLNPFRSESMYSMTMGRRVPWIFEAMPLHLNHGPWENSPPGSPAHLSQYIKSARQYGTNKNTKKKQALDCYKEGY